MNRQLDVDGEINDMSADNERKDLNKENIREKIDTKVKNLRLKLKMALVQNSNLERKLDTANTKAERYNKRIQRLQLQASKNIASLQNEFDLIKARNEILENTLNTTFSSCSK